MSQSYFTRKMTGYLAYKGIPHVQRRFAGGLPEARAAGWPGGIPAVKSPDGVFMWDTTDVIHHLEALFPEPAVMPDDPVQRFLCYALEDVLDEWFYRPAVTSRWFCEENTVIGSWELGRALTYEAPLSGDQARQMVTAYTTATCEPFGGTAANVESWLDEVLRPWLRVCAAHFDTRPYFFGARPSLADFALFGGCAAHFINDPVCRRISDEEGPSVVKHTHRLAEPEDQDFGDWDRAGDVCETLVAVLGDLGRLYLPWVSRATRDGSALLAFASGQRIEITATRFLCEARAVLLARYLDLRSDALDAVLDRAGILDFYAGFTDQAGEIPNPEKPPRGRYNRPYPPPAEQEA